MESDHHLTPKQARFRTWLVAVVIVVPWLSILAAHYVGNGSAATGFIQYDQPYYVANGRAVFERGNGFAYPNPSDADESAPAIYFHWLPWLLGVAVSCLGVNPGTAYSLLNVTLLPVFGWLTWKLISQRCDRHRTTIMILAVWGGGVLSLIGLLKGLATGIPLSEAVFEFDPTEGLWFLNWGRNSVYGIEITYHCFVAASWLMVLRGRHDLALLFAVALGLTHPWSGLETLLVLNAWFFLEALRQRSARNLTVLGWAMAAVILLLGYYKLWLPQFPAHAKLQQHWTLDWRAEWSTVIYAYGPVSLVAAFYALRRGWRLSRQEQFLLVAAATAFCLTIHDRILSRAIQPLHFSRGYVWMPIFLVAVPQFERLFDGISRLPNLRRRLRMAGLLAILCFDNVAFTVTHSIWQYNGDEGFVFSPDDYAAIERIRGEAKGELVLSDSLEMGYVLTTYAPVRSWLCHKFNTPNYVERQKSLRRILADNSIIPDALPAELDVLLLNSARDTTMLGESAEWSLEAHNNSWQIWRKQVVVKQAAHGRPRLSI